MLPNILKLLSLHVLIFDQVYFFSLNISINNVLAFVYKTLYMLFKYNVYLQCLHIYTYKYYISQIIRPHSSIYVLYLFTTSYFQFPIDLCNRAKIYMLMQICIMLCMCCVYANIDMFANIYSFFFLLKIFSIFFRHNIWNLCFLLHINFSLT